MYVVGVILATISTNKLLRNANKLIPDTKRTTQEQNRKTLLTSAT